MVKDPFVEAISTGVDPSTANVDPPSVDFATRKVWPPASGQNAKTSAKAFVLISPPSAVNVVSVPLTASGVPHVPLGPLRALTNAVAPLCQIA